MAEYTALATLGVVATVLFDVLVVRTRVVLTATFWTSLGIMWAFQVLVDGWLTKRSAPIVLYNPDTFSGTRVFFDSPVEDFAFAFAMILLTLSVWDALARRDGERP